jgi:hypothetical protein
MTGTTSAGTSDPTVGTTGDGVCMFPGADWLDVTLEDLDMPKGCGLLEFTGRLDQAGDGEWNLDACPCGAECLVPDPWLLTVQAPGGWLPEVPMCLRIVLETTSSFAPDTCELSGLAIWDLGQPAAPPVYVAGGSPPALDAVTEFSVSSELVETCACDGCCGDDESYRFDFAAGDEVLTLAETDQGALNVGDVTYDVINFQSHVLGVCDAPGNFFWAMKAS